MKYYFCEINSKKQSYLGKLVMLILAMLVSTISFGVKLGTIKGLSKLSNYNELKDVDVSDITTLKIINGIPRQPGKGFSGVAVLYLDGKIIGLSTIKNGKNHGKLYAYTDNGQLIDVGEWKNGVKDGESKNYYEDGQLMNIQIFKNDVLTFAKVYNQDGSIKSTYNQTSGNRGIMEIHTKEGNKETTMKVEVIYKEINRIVYSYYTFIRDGKFEVFDNKGRLLEEGTYKDDEVASSTKIDKFLGFIAQDSTYKVNVEDRDYFFKTLKELNLKGLTEEHYKEQVKLFGNKSFCSSLGMVIPQYYIFEGEPVQALIESYLLKMSKDIKKVSKKYTELNDKDFITKYFKSYCKVPSESSLSFVKDYNKDPKALREFLKNPVIK